MLIMLMNLKMTTHQAHIQVHCLRNDFWNNRGWINTPNVLLSASRIRFLSLENVLQRRSTREDMQVFTAGNSVAVNVVSVLKQAPV